MPVERTQLILSPLNDGTKRMRVVGAVAVNEIVDVTIEGMAPGGVVPAGMFLRVTSHSGRVEYARFPADLGDTWTVSGINLKCALRLNTPALQQIFLCLCSTAVVEGEIKLENGVTDTLYASNSLTIRNWIQNPLSPVAGSALLQTQLDVLAVRIGAHQHDDSEESASFPHNNLLDRDLPGAHPAIEGAVANAALVAANAQSAAETAGNNAAAAQETADRAVALTDAMQDGVVLNHLTKHDDGTAVKAMINTMMDVLNNWRQRP